MNVMGVEFRVKGVPEAATASCVAPAVPLKLKMFTHWLEVAVEKANPFGVTCGSVARNLLSLLLKVEGLDGNNEIVSPFQTPVRD